MYFFLFPLCPEDPLKQNCVVAQGAKTLKKIHIYDYTNWEKESFKAREVG